MEDTNSKNVNYKQCFVGDLSEHISRLNADKIPLHDVMSFRKEINGTILDIALQWCLDRYSYTVLGYANRIRTIDGGTHIDGVKASITRIINSLAKESKAVKEKDINLSEDNVWEGLTCIVSVTVPNPEFEGQTKTKLGNLYVREIVDQSVHKYLAEYFELHPDILEIIITKSIYANKAAALAFKREKNLLRSKIVSMPCTIPEKLAYCSSDNSDIFIGKGDSSSSDANRDSQRRFQRKRTREQPGSDDAISTAFEGSIENTSNSNFEKKHKNQKFCVPSSSPSLSLKKPAETSARKPKAQDAHDKKRLEDVVHDSKKTRAVVPIGPGFQAEIPVWIAPTKKGAFYGSPGDSKTLKWLGTGVWPTYSLKDEVHYKDSDRLRSNSCTCASPGSTTCIKQHIKKAKDLLERGLRNAFYTWKFHEIGENVSKSWTAKEEQKFEELVKKNPLSSSEGFWEFAYKHFPQKSRKDLISYYHNVFLIKRMRMLSKSSDGHFDSDDDNYDDFLGRKAFCG